MSTIRRRGRSRRPIGFTLLELLVVVTIVVLVSAVAIAAIVPALMHQQVGSAARILQAALVGARDNAIRANAPRGIRLLPDPAFATNPSILASNRFVPIETAPDYTEGLVAIWPVPDAIYLSANPPPFAPAPYPTPQATGGFAYTNLYPYYPPTTPLGLSPNNPSAGQVLMVEQAPYTAPLDPASVPAGSSQIAPPTNWFWNVRIGDKVRINNSGRSYTVVGPMSIPNPELFVNVGKPGDQTNYLYRTYSVQAVNSAPPPPFTYTPGKTVAVEFLYLVNGQDDGSPSYAVGYPYPGFPGDGKGNPGPLVPQGYVDSGWDGLDNDDNGVVDDIFEWQVESWTGNQRAQLNNLSYGPVANNTSLLPLPQAYALTRRPVPSQGAREVALPSGAVIDLTSWNAAQLGVGSGLPERSRLPVDPYSRYVDIMLDPSGQVVPTTTYSSPSEVSMFGAFYHFWIAERQDLHEVTEAWAAKGGTPPAGATFLLPIPAEFTQPPILSAANQPAVYLKGDRMLVTLYGRTGQVVTNRLDSVNLAVPGDPSTNSFNAGNSNFPYIQAQLGVREAK